MSRTSAGLLLYRRREGALEVLLVRPGGRGRCRSGGPAQQRVLDRMAAALGPPAIISRGRPRRLVPAGRCPPKDQPGAGRPAGRVGGLRLRPHWRAATGQVFLPGTTLRPPREISRLRGDGAQVGPDGGRVAAEQNEQPPLEVPARTAVRS